MNKNSNWSRWCRTSALVFTLILSGSQLTGCGGIEDLRQRFGQTSSSGDSTALRSEEAMAAQQKACPVKSEDRDDGDEDENESEDESKDDDYDADEKDDEADLALKAKKDKTKGGKGCGDTTTGGTSTPPAPTPTPTPTPAPAPAPAPTPTPTPAPAPTPGASLAEGQKIYNANCQGCHGALPGEKQGRSAAQILSASGVGSHRNVTPWPAGQASALSAQLAAESLSMALK